MPIKPRPFTVVCEDCHWKKTVAPRSDALMPGEGIDLPANDDVGYVCGKNAAACKQLQST